MTRILLLTLTTALFACKTTTYYVVRHAEKEASTTITDVPLSAAGRQRADALREALKSERIDAIYSTNYVRTRTTAQPLAAEKGVDVRSYDPRDTVFINNLRKATNSVLIVGHSNTVDDIVNRLMGARTINGDLPDTQYGDLFIVRKKGKHFSFSQKTFGAPLHSE